MKLRRVRLTVRWALVAVALMGGGLGAYVGMMRESPLAATYRERLAEHRMWKEIHRQSAEQFHLLWLKAVEDQDPECEDYRETAEWDERRVKFHGEMIRKYEFAASHPWIPVAPDPPLPD